MSQKILIIQTAFIGDVVLATALAEKLHQFHPGAQIDFLVRKGNESLLTGHPFLNEVLVWDKKKRKFIGLWQLMKQIRKRKYDLVVNVQRFFASGFLTAFSGAGIKAGFDKNPMSFLFTRRAKHIIGDKKHPLHEVDRNQLLISVETDGNAARPRLYPSPADYESIKPLQQHPYIVIAPGSVWFTKQYPEKKWMDFINKLPSSINVFLIGGASDMELCRRIQSGCPGRQVHNLCGQYSFLQSAALQQGALMNYVNDSAPLHFTSAMNAPVTAVFCSTIPLFGYGPLSENHHIVESEHPLSCRPCGLHGQSHCPKGHFNCANLIADEQLLAVLKYQ
jgi:heptosyltransferase-2